MSQSQSDVSKTIELMKSAFECPICLELLDNPVLTRCGHVFCCGCLLRTLNKKSLSVPCPLCKKTVSKRGLQELRLWSQIITKLKLLPVAFENDVKDAAGKCDAFTAVHNDGHHDSSIVNKQQLAKSAVFHQLQATVSASEPDRKSFSRRSSRSVFVEKPSRQLSCVQNNAGNVKPVIPIASSQYSDMINEQRLKTIDVDEHTVVSVDPYEYIGSQLTPKVHCRTKHGKRSRHSLDFNIFDDVETIQSGVPKRESRQSRGKSTSVMMRGKRKWKSDGADPEEANENSHVTSDKEALKLITGDISDAEKYDLIVSQSHMRAGPLQSIDVRGSAAVSCGIVNEIQGSNVVPARELLSESCRLRADDEDTQKYSIDECVRSVQCNYVPIGLAHGTGDMEVDMRDSISETVDKSVDEHLEYQSQRIGLERLHDGNSSANCVSTNLGNDQLEMKDFTHWPNVAPSSPSTGASCTNDEIPFAAYNTPETNPDLGRLSHYAKQIADVASCGGVVSVVHNQPTTLVASESAFEGLAVATLPNADQFNNGAEVTADTDTQQVIAKGSVKRSRSHVIDISENFQQESREISQIIGRHSLDSEASSISDSDQSEGDSTDSMEILTQMLEYETPNPELQSKSRKYQRRRAIKSGHKYETSATVLQRSVSPPVSGCDAAKFKVPGVFPVTERQVQESFEQFNALPKRSLAQLPEVCANTIQTLSLIENKENVSSGMKLPDSTYQLDENQSKGSYSSASLFDEYFAAKSVDIAARDNVVNTEIRAENIGVVLNEINISSVDTQTKKAKKTRDRKTFSLQAESQSDEKNFKQPLMTDSLEIMSVINEVADIFQQKTNGSSRSSSSVGDEDLSTQEIDAYLNRDFPERAMFKVPTAVKYKSDVKKNEKKNSAANAVKSPKVPADYSEPSGGSVDENTLSSQSEHSCSVLDSQFAGIAVQLPVCLESTDDLSEANQPAALLEDAKLPRLSKHIQGVAPVSSSVYGEISSQLLPQSLLGKEFDVEMDEFVNQSAASTVEWQEAGSQNELNGDNLSDSESEAAIGMPVSRKTVSPCSIRSTQSELLTTQQHYRLKQDVSNIESEIALLHAKLMADGRTDVPTSETDYLCDLVDENDSDVADMQSTTDELAGQIAGENEKMDVGVLNNSSKQLSVVVSGNLHRSDLLASRNNNKQHTSASISKDSNPLPDSLVEQLENEFEMDQNEGVDFSVGTGAFKLQDELDVDSDNEVEANVCTFNENVDILVGRGANRGTKNQPQSKLSKQRDEEREQSSVSGETDNEHKKVKEANTDLVVRTNVQTKSSNGDDVGIDSSSDSEDDLFVSPAKLQNYDEVDEIPASFESDTPESGEPQTKINASSKAIDMLDVSRVYSGIIPGGGGSGGNTEFDVQSSLNRKIAAAASTEDGSSLDTTIDCGQGNRIAPEEIITISSSPSSSVPSHSISDFMPGQEKLLNRYPSSSPDFANRRLLNSLPNQRASKSPVPDRFPKMPHWTIVASSISKDTDQPFVDALVSNLGCRFVPKFVYGTTHVLVKPVCEGSRRCFRTLKYFQGVAHKTWVLSVDWARDSIVKQKLMPPEKYEILGDAAVDEDHCGPTKARLSSTPLLLHYEVCCFGSYEDLTPDDLRGLLKACGANIVYDPMMFTYDVTMNQLIIVDSMPSGDKDVRKLHDVSRRYRAPVVIKDWLLDSVGTFDVKPLNAYLVTPWTKSRMSLS